jgi:hypothetical protein
MAASFDSGPCEVGGAEKGLIEVSWAGANGAGTVKLQATGSGAFWFDLDGTLRPINSASGALGIPLPPVVYTKVRVAYTAGTISEGTMTVFGTAYFDRIDNQPIRDS